MIKHHLLSPVCLPVPLPSPLVALGVILGFLLLCCCCWLWLLGGLLAYLAAFFRVAVPRAALTQL